MEGQVRLQSHGAAGDRKDPAEAEGWADPRGGTTRSSLAVRGLAAPD